MQGHVLPRLAWLSPDGDATERRSEAPSVFVAVGSSTSYINHTPFRYCMPSPFSATVCLCLVFAPGITQLTLLPSTSIFSRLFTFKSPAKKYPQQEVDDDTAPSSPVSPRSLRSPLSPTTLSSLPSPSSNTSRSFRPGIGQPPVFQRPSGTATSGIILPKRKDGRDPWTAHDNPLAEEPDDLELLESQILVTGWLAAGAAAEAGAADGDADQTSRANRKSSEEEAEAQSKLEVIATPAPKLVLQIDTDTDDNKSPSAPVPAPAAANHNKKDKVPELATSFPSTVGSPSITITSHAGEVKSLSETDTNPPHGGTLLPTIKEPDATAEEEERDQVVGDLTSLSPPPEKKRRGRSILARLGSRRFRPLARSNSSASATTTTTTATTATTATTTDDAPKRRRTLAVFVRRPTSPPTPNKASLEIAEEKMVQPIIHTPASLNTHIMEIEDEEERQRAETFFG